MIKKENALSYLQNDVCRATLAALYPYQEMDVVIARYTSILDQFETIFGRKEEIAILSAPGRSEIGGNHTDHQGGHVVSASINLDAVGIAAPNGTSLIRLQSQGHDRYEVDISDVSIQESEKNTTAALLRGVAARFVEMGYPVAGFDAYVSSDVLPGSGLSSSATFEVWTGVAINHLFCGDSVSAEEIAKISQYAENHYFGKPSGLQDQMASSVGGMIAIDFADRENPIIEKLPFEFSDMALCIIDSGGDHSNLTDEYAAIPQEMGQIASAFQQDRMCGVKKADFLSKIPALRKQFGDRAVLRAFHFLKEDKRAIDEAQALKQRDLPRFLSLVKASGESSYMYLQNIYPTGAVQHQEVAIALALCDEYLEGQGAFRVHGGGFAGTIQAFVPRAMLDAFVRGMDGALGAGSCHVLSIRPVGGTVIA